MKTAKVIPLHKKDELNNIEITGQYHCYHHYLRFLKKLYLINLTTILTRTTYFAETSRGGRGELGQGRTGTPPDNVRCFQPISF